MEFFLKTLLEISQSVKVERNNTNKQEADVKTSSKCQNCFVDILLEKLENKMGKFLYVRKK